MHTELLVACALTYLAFRKGSYEIWRDTALEKRLKDLEVESATASPAPAESPPNAPPTAAAQELAVVLVATKAGRKRDVIRTLRRLAGQDYGQARSILDRVPVVVARGMTPEQAASIKTAFEQGGADAVVMSIPVNDNQSPGE